VLLFSVLEAEYGEQGESAVEGMQGPMRLKHLSGGGNISRVEGLRRGRFGISVMTVRFATEDY
jgi:hypothetical protein